MPKASRVLTRSTLMAVDYRIKSKCYGVSCFTWGSLEVLVSHHSGSGTNEKILNKSAEDVYYKCSTHY